MVRSTAKDMRQEAILCAAREIIADFGVNAVTMADLAVKSQLSRPALYQYFASKEHVLAELIINEMADLSNAIDEKMALFEDPSERIRVWIHYSLAHLASSEHRAIRQISVDTLPAESRSMMRDMHGHVMTSLINPLSQLGVKDPAATCHLIYAAVAAAAAQIDEGADYVREAAALERFAIAGIEGTLA